LEVSLVAQIVFDVMLKLVDGDRDQELPQVAAALDVVTPSPRIPKKAPIRRLDHVLRVDTLRQFVG
jgi:hypothetical protein